MRPPSRRLAPRGGNRQAAPPRPSGGGARGPEGPPLPAPPPSGPRADGGGPERERPRTPPGEAAAPGGGRAPRPRQAPPLNRPHASALPVTDRQRTGGAQDGANGAAPAEDGLAKAGARTKARRSLLPSPPPPPPPHRPIGRRPDRTRRPRPAGNARSTSIPWGEGWQADARRGGRAA